MNIVRAFPRLTPFPVEIFALFFVVFSDFDPRGLLEAEGRPANMIQKMLINECLTLVPTYATSWNWFVCIFSRKSWYREVQGSFLSPFHDHFCFPERSSEYAYTSIHMFFVFSVPSLRITGSTEIFASLGGRGGCKAKLTWTGGDQLLQRESVPGKWKPIPTT